MPDLKPILSALAILLIFIAYVPYIRDIVKGKTHPHAYTWFTLATTGVVVFALQLHGNAGAGAYVTLAASLNAYLVCFLGLKYGKRDITRSDTVFLVLALISMVFWLLAKQPVLSVIILCAVEVLAFLPTVRKTWNKPYSETFSTYTISVVRFGLALLALNQYNVLTVLYPGLWLIGNALFCILLFIRRPLFANPHTI
jgi:hypothetical protein